MSVYTNIKMWLLHKLRGAVGTRQLQMTTELYYRDILLLLSRLDQLTPTPFIALETQYPVAVSSNDHKFPWGTMNDNTRSPRFVHVCETLFTNRPLSFLDLGCAGGGLVLEFVLRGHRAMGLEGSDASLRTQRAEWRVLPNNLLTCDITKPFSVKDQISGGTMKFNVISMWEVLEHISENDLPQLFENILLHLATDGIFIGSIALGPDLNPQTGANYHLTVQSQAWWRERFSRLGLEFTDDHPFSFYDFCRGVGNGPLDPNYSKSPERGFHFVAHRKPTIASQG